MFVSGLVLNEQEAMVKEGHKQHSFAQISAMFAEGW